MRRLLLASLALAVACFAALLAGLWFALPRLEALVAAAAPAWIAGIVGIVAAAGAVLLSVVLFPAAVTAIQSAFFVEPACDAVERRHYPGLPPPRAAGVGEQARIAAAHLGVAVGLNLLALPLYFVPVLNVATFLALNGFLLAREHVLAVAIRRMDRPAAIALWRARRLRFWAAGAGMALIMAIPLVNLAGALFCAATMTHMVAQARRDPS
jgi:uncharacterized protein involved in cysteine biosynthesis